MNKKDLTNFVHNFIQGLADEQGEKVMEYCEDNFNDTEGTISDEIKEAIYGMDVDTIVNNILSNSIDSDKNNITSNGISTTVFNISIPVNALKDVKVEYCDEDDDKYPDPLWEDITRLWETASESLYQNGKEVRELMNNGSVVELTLVYEDGHTEGFEAYNWVF